MADGTIQTEAVISAAREVGDHALGKWRHLRGGGSLDQWSKPDQTLVSEVDMEVDRRLHAMLGAIDPAAGTVTGTACEGFHILNPLIRSIF